MTEKNHKYWEERAERLNELFKELQQKPNSEKKGFSLHPGGILNAYREGDLSFTEALDRLQKVPIILTDKNFLNLQELCKAFEIANLDEVTSVTLSVTPFGSITWHGDKVVEIRLGTFLPPPFAPQSAEREDEPS